MKTTKNKTMKLPVVFGQVGCYVRFMGSRNKHKVVAIADVGNYMPDCVCVEEIKSGEEKLTTWSCLTNWVSKVTYT